MKISDEIKQGIACDSVGKPDSILGRAICLSVHPGKMALFPFVRWFNKRYKGRYKFARVMFSIDLVLLSIAATLFAVFAFVSIVQPKSFSDKIIFEATVAPREIVSGASSTLVIRFTNTSKEDLRDVTLNFQYPDHFLLQEISSKNNEISGQNIFIPFIASGTSGSVHIRGVMFGDIGGQQSFTSTMTFTHGEKASRDTKIDTHTFTPVDSALVLSLHLPERLVAFQNVDGFIEYENTGEVELPTINILPTWPDRFSLLSIDASTVDGQYEVPAILPGEKGVMDFSGFLGNVGKEAVFEFLPSYTFGDTRYNQQMLTHIAPVVPPQITVDHTIETDALKPGGTAEVTVSYKHEGEFPVYDAEIGITSESPFLAQKEVLVDSNLFPELEELQPGDEGILTLDLHLKSSVVSSQTSQFENLSVSSKTLSYYTLGDGTSQRVTSLGPEITVPLTTPLVLDSFGRYMAASGDQLGRGPLPPRVGIETKYWIFWNVRGTTNNIRDLHIEGTLAPGVRFTGKQTVSHNNATVYNKDTHSVSWESALISPTLSPSSKIVGIAFEVGITPTEDMLGTSPLLLSSILATGRDARTGAFVSASGSPISTALFNDIAASGKSLVE